MPGPAAGAPAAGPRTELPGAPPYGPHPPQTVRMPPGQPGVAAGYPQPGAPTFVPPAPSTRKPVALLAALLVLLLAGVAGACLWVAGAKRGAPLLGGRVAAVPTGTGVTQSASPDAAPPAPGVIAAPNGTPPSGAPVTGAVRRPDGSAPPILMAPNSSASRAPSVMVSPGVATPAAPPVVASPGLGAPAGAPVTGSPSARPTRGPSAVAAPQPAPRDNSDFDAYLQWLRFVENERKQLADSAQNMATVLMVQGQADLLKNMLALSDPDVNPQQLQSDTQRKYYQAFMEFRRRMMVFHHDVFSTKPRVPQDCRRLDADFTAAIVLEAKLEEQALRAMSNSDLMAALQTKSATADIYARLRDADRELDEVSRARGVSKPFSISGGEQTSTMDVLRGLGVFK